MNGIQGIKSATEKNWVNWFIRTIREFGGNYTPFREWGSDPRKVHTCGRRESRRMPYPLDKAKYSTDRHGSIRRIKINQETKPWKS